MNKTILTIGIALLMLGIPASAKMSPTEDVKAEIGEEIGVQNINCGLGDGVHSLVEATPVSSSLPAITGASCEFSFTPAAGADLAKVVLNGMSSDFDLYTRVNGIPTTSLWNCRPYSGGTTAETCQLAVNSGDFVGVMVRRFSGSGAFTVTASSVIIPTLENGVPMQASLPGSGSTTFFKLIVPDGSTLANFALAPSDDVSAGSSVCQVQTGVTSCSPDADLYVRFGAIPTTSAFSCRPYTYGNVEACTFSTEASGAGTDPAGLGVNNIRPFYGAGKYYVMLRSFSGAPNVVLQGTTA